METVYPPERHILRDLGLEFEPGEGVTNAWMAATDLMLDAHGHVRAGVLATFVDVIGGGLAAVAAAPGWIATADLTLHLLAPAKPGRLRATGRVVRAGRTTVVIETDVHGGAGAVAWSTMTFAVLERRDSNPVIVSDDGTPVHVRTTMATETSGMRVPVLDAVGVVGGDSSVQAGPAAWLREPTDYVENSLGAVQGGVVALLVDRAAELAAIDAGVVNPSVVDLHLNYFALNRTGPVEAVGRVLDGADAQRAAVTVEVTDHSTQRLTAVARVGVAASTSTAGDGTAMSEMSVQDAGHSAGRFAEPVKVGNGARP